MRNDLKDSSAAASAATISSNLYPLSDLTSSAVPLPLPQPNFPSETASAHASEAKLAEMLDLFAARMEKLMETNNGMISDTIKPDNHAGAASSLAKAAEEKIFTLLTKKLDEHAAFISNTVKNEIKAISDRVVKLEGLIAAVATANRVSSAADKGK